MQFDTEIELAFPDIQQGRGGRIKYAPVMANVEHGLAIHPAMWPDGRLDPQWYTLTHVGTGRAILSTMALERLVRARGELAALPVVWCQYPNGFTISVMKSIIEIRDRYIEEEEPTE